MAWSDQINSLNSNINDLIGMNNQRTAQAVQNITDTRQTANKQTWDNIWKTVDTVMGALQQKKGRDAASQAQAREFQQRMDEIRQKAKDAADAATTDFERQKILDAAKADLARELAKYQEGQANYRTSLSLGGRSGANNEDLFSVAKDRYYFFTAQHPDWYTIDDAGQKVLDPSKVDWQGLQDSFNKSIIDRTPQEQQTLRELFKGFIQEAQGTTTGSPTTYDLGKSQNLSPAGVYSNPYNGRSGTVPAKIPAPTRADQMTEAQAYDQNAGVARSVEDNNAIKTIQSLLTQIPKTNNVSTSSGYMAIPNPDIQTLKDDLTKFQGGLFEKDSKEFFRVTSEIRRIMDKYGVR